MKLLVVGTPEDVTGFALAGVEGVVARSRKEAAETIAHADADTLVIVSENVAVPSKANSLVVVMPGTRDAHAR